MQIYFFLIKHIHLCRKTVAIWTCFNSNTLLFTPRDHAHWIRTEILCKTAALSRLELPYEVHPCKKSFMWFLCFLTSLPWLPACPQGFFSPLKNSKYLRNRVRFVILQVCRGYRRARRVFSFKNSTCLGNSVRFVILQVCRGYRCARRGFFFSQI